MYVVEYFWMRSKPRQGCNLIAMCDYKVKEERKETPMELEKGAWRGRQ